MTPEAPDTPGTLTRLADDEPERHDVFLGLVAPIGSSRAQVVKALITTLRPYDYRVEHIRLADLLDAVAPTADPLPRLTDRGYYEARMDAGDRLRRGAGDDSALAAMAVARVASIRQPSEGDGPQPTCFVFDSLKHPREADLLKSVYGTAFWLVSIVEDSAVRTKNLADVLAKQEGSFSAAPEARADALIARDEADPDAAHGQHVRDVFSDADFFLPVQRGGQWRREVERFVRGVFAAPFLTPTADEEAMRHAQAAALRSAAIGRQVGAVIVPPLGTPYLLGTNEVPRPGGGQYREGDEPDHRDFQAGADPNPAYTERVIRELIDRLSKARYFTEERNAAGGNAILREATAPDANGRSVLDGTRAKSLIEFTRCLHAEQAAIVDAARSGVAIAGARLYTTTFPCHECTKFIIGAGIFEVQYIEPYPKSLAGDLFGDLIDTVPPLTARRVEPTNLERVPFRPFVGFGPHRYDDVFRSGERRDGNGIAEHDPGSACPVGLGWSDVAVQTKESEVVLAITSVVRRLREQPPESKATEAGDNLDDGDDSTSTGTVGA